MELNKKIKNLKIKNLKRFLIKINLILIFCQCSYTNIKEMNTQNTLKNKKELKNLLLKRTDLLIEGFFHNILDVNQAVSKSSLFPEEKTHQQNIFKGIQYKYNGFIIKDISNCIKNFTNNFNDDVDKIYKKYPSEFNINPNLDLKKFIENIYKKESINILQKLYSAQTKIKKIEYTDIIKILIEFNNYLNFFDKKYFKVVNHVIIYEIRDDGTTHKIISMNPLDIKKSKQKESNEKIWLFSFILNYSILNHFISFFISFIFQNIFPKLFNSIISFFLFIFIDYMIYYIILKIKNLLYKNSE